MTARQIQVLFLSVFIGINVLIFQSAEIKVEDGNSLHPTYWNASDGQRYWGAALGIANKGAFTVTETNEPLRRAGPIPALLFSAPIYLVGLDRASGWIIGMHCVLLFISGIVARQLCKPYHANQNIIQGLIIFNPNLITLSHHAQSDLVFMFVATLLFVLVGKIFQSCGRSGLRLFIAIGIVAGLLSLTRPLGFYYSLLLPGLILVALLSQVGERVVYWRHVVVGLLVSVFVATAIVMPWGLRNKEVFDDFFLTESEGIMMQWHYRTLQLHRVPGSNENSEGYYLDRYGIDSNCIDRPFECKGNMTRAYLRAILDVPPRDIVRVLIISSGKLFFTGGVSQLGRYLGLNPPSVHDFLMAKGELVEEVKKMRSRFENGSSYFWLFFIAAVVFASICRVVGIIGLVSALKKKLTWQYSIYYILTILFFSGLYLFSGIARFRAPLEPILMLFASIGITWVISCRKSRDL